MPCLPINDKRTEEKRKKARAAQQKHREKIKKEKDALIKVFNDQIDPVFNNVGLTYI